MSPADEGAAGISASLGDEGAALQRARTRSPRCRPARGPGRAAPVRSARRRRVAAEADKELAALKAEIGPGSPAPPELAGS